MIMEYSVKKVAHLQLVYFCHVLNFLAGLQKTLGRLLIFYELCKTDIANKTDIIDVTDFSQEIDPRQYLYPRKYVLHGILT